jgi:quinolinate synthase
MIRFATQSPSERFLVATETGILHRLRQEAPSKRFEPVREDAICRYMKMITLDKLHDSLQNNRHRVVVDQEVVERARLAIDRMVAIGP